MKIGPLAKEERVLLSHKGEYYISAKRVFLEMPLRDWLMLVIEDKYCRCQFLLYGKQDLVNSGLGVGLWIGMARNVNIALSHSTTREISHLTKHFSYKTIFRGKTE